MPRPLKLVMGNKETEFAMKFIKKQTFTQSLWPTVQITSGDAFANITTN
jgi:hypothetical protein